VEKLGAEVNVKVTYRDYLQFPDDGRRYEVIDGEVLVTPAPNLRHQRVLGRLYSLVDAHVRTQKLGEVLFAPCDVVFTDTTVVQPDLIFVSNGRRGVVERSRIVGAPDLVAEILSPSTATRDRSLKLQSYERHGVAHYWLLDPERGELEEYVLAEGKYRLVSKLAGPVPFQPRVFAGLTLDLGQVWAE
jgi:Uma2 family endonuclease